MVDEKDIQNYKIFRSLTKEEKYQDIAEDFARQYDQDGDAGVEEMIGYLNDNPNVMASMSDHDEERIVDMLESLEKGVNTPSKKMNSEDKNKYKKAIGELSRRTGLDNVYSMMKDMKVRYHNRLGEAIEGAFGGFMAMGEILNPKTSYKDVYEMALAD